jgi:hypothetical protein
MRMFLDGDYRALRVGDEVTFRVDGRVVMVAEETLEVEIEDAELEDADTVEEAGRRAMRSLLRDNPSSESPSMEHHPG